MCTGSAGTEHCLCTFIPKLLHLNPVVRTHATRQIQSEEYSAKQLTLIVKCYKEKKRNVLEQRCLRDITFKCNERSLVESWIKTKRKASAIIGICGDMYMDHILYSSHVSVVCSLQCHCQVQCPGSQESHAEGFGVKNCDVCI